MATITLDSFNEKIPVSDVPANIVTAQVATVDLSSASIPTGSTINVIRIPKGARIIDLSVYVTTITGVGSSIAVGDSSASDTFISAITPSDNGSLKRMTGSGMGKTYTTEDGIILTTSGATISAINMRVVVVYSVV